MNEPCWFRINRQMRFYTKDECEQWLRGVGRAKPDSIPEIHRAHVHYPAPVSRILYLAQWVAGSLMYRQPALVWIPEWGIWDENWHLYYKLRQSYGDLPRRGPRSCVGRICKQILETFRLECGGQWVKGKSDFMTLLPGDVISTGTPAGVGLGMNPQVYLKHGDVVELGIDGLGTSKQNVRAYAKN